MIFEEFIARLDLPLGAKIAEFHFTEESVIDAVPGIQPERVAANVMCGFTACDKQTALKAAEAAFAIVDGKEVFLRVAPEADSITDFMTGKVEHRGYVRFSFFDRPGVCHQPRPWSEMRYAGLAKATA